MRLIAQIINLVVCAIIIIFGVFNYLEVHEVKKLCKKLQNWVKQDGIIIIKHQEQEIHVDLSDSRK